MKSIWPIDGTLTGKTIPGQSAPGRNGNVGALLQTSQTQEMKPHHQT